MLVFFVLPKGGTLKILLTAELTESEHAPRVRHGRADKKHKAEINEYVDGLESAMRNHQEFEEVHADDLESLAVFRNIMGLNALSLKSTASVASVRHGQSDGDESEYSLDNVIDLFSTVPSTGSRSIGSRASRSSRLAAR